MSSGRRLGRFQLVHNIPHSLFGILVCVCLVFVFGIHNKFVLSTESRSGFAIDRSNDQIQISSRIFVNGFTLHVVKPKLIGIFRAPDVHVRTQQVFTELLRVCVCVCHYSLVGNRTTPI